VASQRRRAVAGSRVDRLHPHRTQPGFESAVVGLEAAVASRSKTCRAAGDEGSCGVGVAAGRHENVDDLTVLIDRR
jgi:hypothetical protein